jgi:hypothetical protein
MRKPWAIHLVVDTLVLSGSVSADGISRTGRGGGGAGGSVWIEVDRLEGPGEIRANGGNSGSGGGGGGGRIAIYASNTLSATVSADGGTGGSNGGDGTVYLDGTDPLASTVEATTAGIVADGVSTGTITITLRTNTGIPIPGKAVQIDQISGSDLYLNGQPFSSSAPPFEIGTSNLSGTVTAVVSGTVAGQRTFGARNDEIIQDEASVTFVAGPVDVDGSTLQTDVSTLIADGLEQANLTASLFDSYDNPVPGKTLLIQATGQVSLTQALTCDTKS